MAALSRLEFMADSKKGLENDPFLGIQQVDEDAKSLIREEITAAQIYAAIRASFVGRDEKVRIKEAETSYICKHNKWLGNLPLDND